MKIAATLLVFALLFMPFQGVSAALQQNTIVITADQVAGADDIEAAIIAATSQGTQPGTVILDGQKGAFVFTHLDRSLNIFVSNLTLLGVNQAVIANCDDGLFFDDFPLTHILVEELTFICNGDGIQAWGVFEDVTLRDNTFLVEMDGFSMSGASSGWLITGNVIDTPRTGVGITGASEFVITNNQIAGHTALRLAGTSQFQVRKNTLEGIWYGVVLTEAAALNRVQSNTITGVSHAGIRLEAGVTGNWILANRVYPEPGTLAVTIDAPPELWDVNKIAGNQP